MSRQVTLRDPKFDPIKMAIAFGAYGSDHPACRTWAVKKWGEAGSPIEVMKAAESANSISSLDSIADGLIDRQIFGTVRERSALMRMRGIRRTGFRVRSITSSPAVATWVAEGKAAPILSANLDNVGLDAGKIVGMTAATKEALEATPGIERLLYNDLAQAYAVALDEAAFDPLNDGSGVEPASLTHLAPAISGTGDITSDLADLFEVFTGDLLGAYFVCAPETAAALATREVGRELGVRGGELAGVPVLTTNGSPRGQLALIDPGGVMAAWDNDDSLVIEVGREGSIEFDSEPVGDSVAPTGTANVVSLWTTNTLSFRAVGHFGWARARPGSAAILTGLEPVAS